MRTASHAALIGVLLVGAVMALSPVSAQPVPVPTPAPQPKAAAAGTGAQPGVPLSLGAQPQPAPVVRPPAAAAGKPGGTLAFDGNQRALVERVNAYLTSVGILVGDFVQVGPDGGRTQGKFYLQKPGRVRFEYDAPSPVELISDGQSVVVRDRKLATQDLYPLSQTPLRFLLSDRIDLLRDTSLVGVYADDLFVTVVIEEKQLIGGSHRLMLMFGAKDFQLKQWTVTDPQGYDTTVAVYNLDATQKRLDPTLFKINYERVLQ